MSQIRFNHIFITLMLLAALTAFVLPPHISTVVQTQMQFLFTPISKPTWALASWFHGRVTPQHTRDDASAAGNSRNLDDVLRENNDLRIQVGNLTVQLDKLKETNADRAKLGPIRDFCTPVPVVGGDAGLTESLRVGGGSSLDGLRDGMVVLCADGVLGRLSVGAGASTVKLTTAKGNKIIVSFGRYVRDDSGMTQLKMISYPAPVASGAGSGKMIVNNQKWKELKDTVQVGDVALVNDPDWPKRIEGYRVGRVALVRPQPGASGFGEIQIESQIDPRELKEVMVLSKF